MFQQTDHSQTKPPATAFAWTVASKHVSTAANLGIIVAMLRIARILTSICRRLDFARPVLQIAVEIGIVNRHGSLSGQKC